MVSFLFTFAIFIFLYLSMSMIVYISIKIILKAGEDRANRRMEGYKKQYYKKQKNMSYDKWKIPPSMQKNSTIPECLILLGFTDYPEDVDSIKKRYRELAKKKHPDRGGTKEEFEVLNKAYKQTLELQKYNL